MKRAVIFAFHHHPHHHRPLDCSRFFKMSGDSWRGSMASEANWISIASHWNWRRAVTVKDGDLDSCDWMNRKNTRTIINLIPNNSQEWFHISGMSQVAEIRPVFPFHDCKSLGGGNCLSVVRAFKSNATGLIELTTGCPSGQLESNRIQRPAAKQFTNWTCESHYRPLNSNQTDSSDLHTQLENSVKRMKRTIKTSAN